MPRRRLIGLLALVGVFAMLAGFLVVGDSGGGAVREPTDDRATAPSGPETSTTTTPITERFEGDPDSPFCVRSREIRDERILDPFEDGIEADEVRFRYLALTNRFAEFQELAPPALVDDMATLVAALAAFSELLEGADYDFAVLARSGVEVSVFDDPAFAEAGARIDAYREQVCNTL